MDNREALIALNMVENVGPVRARLLIEYFGEAPKILMASKSELMRAFATSARENRGGGLQ